MLRQVSKLPRAPPDVRKKQKKSQTDVREETSSLHKQRSVAPNAATRVDAHHRLYIHGANWGLSIFQKKFFVKSNVGRNMVKALTITHINKTR